MVHKLGGRGKKEVLPLSNSESPGQFFRTTGDSDMHPQTGILPPVPLITAVTSGRVTDGRTAYVSVWGGGKQS